MSDPLPLFILLVDDEPDVLQQLSDTLPTELEGCQLVWDPCPTFEDALIRLESRRYDVVVTDLAFRSAPGAEVELRGLKTIEQIRGKRFCPVVAYSSRSKPDDFIEDVFVKFADKAQANDDIIAKLREVLTSGIPSIARRLHDELDGIGGRYLWDFLAGHWADLEKVGSTEAKVLDRLIRRRAATQLARLEGDIEIAAIGAAEFYLYPRISGGDYRLGEIVKSRQNEEYRVVLTPHCYLAVQAGAKEPRADFVLTLKTVRATDEISKYPKYKNTVEADRPKTTETLIKSRPDIGSPRGRFWFLPRFLKMPDLYCDLMQVESVPLKTLQEDYESFAVLDTPFAEALQSRFVEFYSAVGMASLRPDEFLHLIPKAGE